MNFFFSFSFYALVNIFYIFLILLAIIFFSEFLTIDFLACTKDEKELKFDYNLLKKNVIKDIYYELFNKIPIKSIYLTYPFCFPFKSGNFLKGKVRIEKWSKILIGTVLVLNKNNG